MALKAGYVGIKKSMTGLLNRLSSAKIIKTIGDGLNLTSAGTLKVDINSETMEFVNHKLSAKSVSIDYSTDEQLTGRKWIDGRDIYEKTYTFESTQNIGQTGNLLITSDYSDIALIISAQAVGSEEAGAAESQITSSGIKFYATPSIGADAVIIDYVKVEEE